MEFTKENIKLICADNMKIMAQYPDNYFDLACLDPEYGIGIASNSFRQKQTKKDWDEKTPDELFFAEIFRISKNQIIWGGHYFDLQPTQGFIIWDKKQPYNFSSAMCEMAWTSFQKPAKIYSKHVVTAEKNKIHPTQKPVKLYDFCFDFAKAQKEWKIIDTNFGSASSAISAYYFGFAEYVGIDIDSDYFNDAVKRFKNETMQQRLF